MSISDVRRSKETSLSSREAQSADGAGLKTSCGSSPAHDANEEQDRFVLLAAIDRLEREKSDLQLALLTTNEHADFLQESSYRLSASLGAEVRERQAAEVKLQRLVEAISREKGDLEILVQILIDQGDDSAEEGEKARIDGLTQIANRRRFDEYLAQEWIRHMQVRTPLSLLICDVDHFKLYNDTLGHQAGDECLRRVAQAINHRFRPCDLVARYGGEEFAIALAQTGRAGALQVAERVRLAVWAAALPHPSSPVCDRVTVSIGLACMVPHTQDPLDARGLIEAADQQLYRAKQSGRNQVSFQHEENSST